MRAQADRDEVTLAIAGALVYALLTGALAAGLTWVSEVVFIPGPTGWDFVTRVALSVAAVMLVGRLWHARG